MHDLAIYRVVPKIGTIFVRPNFIKYKQLYIIISLSDSEDNL